MEAVLNKPGIELTYTPAQLKLFFENEGAKYKIVTKGRRFGATEGAEKAFIEWALEGISPLLWVDTINGNIDRYYERYFMPDLKKLPKGIFWEFNQQKRVLKIRNSIIDFRSADSPEMIEGFGYRKIFLNEAGIILKDDYLYSHAILPMLLDFPESQLIAAGVPKGIHKKDGNPHKFYTLYEKAKEGATSYSLNEFTSFDNPLLDRNEIQMMINEMTEAEAQQEIYGRFVEFSGKNPFAHQYNPKKHESEDAVYNPALQITISIDFNLNPFAVSFSHIWQDNFGLHDHTFDEMEIPEGNLPEMIDRIKLRYGAKLFSCKMTGDAMGKRRELGERDNASLYKQLLRGLNMQPTQLNVKGNPLHIDSRSDVNYVLFHYPDFKVNPKTCPNTCRDFRNVQCDAFGEIIKKNRKDLNQRADFIDCQIYKISTYHKAWINQNQIHQQRMIIPIHQNGNQKVLSNGNGVH